MRQNKRQSGFYRLDGGDTKTQQKRIEEAIAQGRAQAVDSGAAKLIGTRYAVKTKPDPEWLIEYQEKVLAMDFSGVAG